MKRVITFCLTNGCLGYLMYMAVTKGAGWEFNLFRFAVWVWFVCFMTTYLHKPGKKDMVKRYSAMMIPIWASSLRSAVFVLFLASVGWFFPATLLFIHWSCEHTLKTEVAKAKTDNQQSANTTPGE